MTIGYENQSIFALVTIDCHNMVICTGKLHMPPQTSVKVSYICHKKFDKNVLKIS